VGIKLRDSRSSEPSSPPVAAVGRVLRVARRVLSSALSSISMSRTHLFIPSPISAKASGVRPGVIVGPVPNWRWHAHRRLQRHWPPRDHRRRGSIARRQSASPMSAMMFDPPGVKSPPPDLVFSSMARRPISIPQLFRVIIRSCGLAPTRRAIASLGDTVVVRDQIE